MKAKAKKKTVDIVLIIIYIFLTILAFITIFPVLNLVGVSLSSGSHANEVVLFPKGFNIDSYVYVFSKNNILRSFGISVARTVVGVLIQTIITVLTAYPLSKKFKGRTFYAWFFFLGMIFDGGIIPFFMVVKSLGMLNKFASLVIPSAVQVFNIILLTNFYKEIPKELEESAMIDGAGMLTILVKIIIPVSKPAIIAGVVFGMVGHWNAWLDGVMFINTPENYPLQTYIQGIISGGNVQSGSGNFSGDISEKTINAALIISAMLPMIIAYPFLQKYFEKGLILGGVKG